MVTVYSLAGGDNPGESFLLNSIFGWFFISFYSISVGQLLHAVLQGRCTCGLWESTRRQDSRTQGKWEAVDQEEDAKRIARNTLYFVSLDWAFRLSHIQYPLPLNRFLATIIFATKSIISSQELRDPPFILHHQGHQFLHRAESRSLIQFLKMVQYTLHTGIPSQPKGFFDLNKEHRVEIHAKT